MAEDAFNYIATHNHSYSSAYMEAMLKPNYNHWVQLEANNYKVETG
jgi:hypothetical protein